MALLSHHMNRLFLTRFCARRPILEAATKKNNFLLRTQCCSAIAIDTQSSLGGVTRIRWGSATLQGSREEMEDDLVIQPDAVNGFSFAAVFDGHAGFSSVMFLRDELYKECATSLQGGLLLSGKDLNAVAEALKGAFQRADVKLLNWLDMNGEDDSGSTATVLFIGNDVLFISHVGDSSLVLSRSGKAEVLTNPHRPYGTRKASLQEIRRVKEAGGWIVDGRICGDISVSRAFGDPQFKTKKNEMLKKGAEEGRWPPKFIARVQFLEDLVIATPDIIEVRLGSDAEFVVLASDGLWDYMSSSEAVSFVRSQLQKHGDVQVACNELAEAAMDRGSQDNVSIVIAELGRTDWSRVTIQKQHLVHELSQAVATVGIVAFGIWISSSLFFQNPLP